MRILIYGTDIFIRIAIISLMLINCDYIFHRALNFSHRYNIIIMFMRIKRTQYTNRRIE